MLDRRRFLSYIPLAATTFGGMLGFVPQSIAAPAPQGISAIETLMRGHGLIIRALIVSDLIRQRITTGQETDPSLVLDTFTIFRKYLQEFHDNAEEKFLYASMETNNVCFNAIQELKVQHGTGLELTTRMTNLAKGGKMNAELAGYLGDFVKMYTHHAAYEDTIVFPAFEAMEKRSDLAEVSASFDQEEKRVLGRNGFNDFLTLIAKVEKKLGIYELSSSTPQLK
jgi:hemerythrin-like domain-containing protein